MRGSRRLEKLESLCSEGFTFRNTKQDSQVDAPDKIKKSLTPEGTEKMSGTKIAMPQPNSFQSGALSFMSCTSGRESSPLEENDSRQTTEFKTETKKKRFHPLRNLRRMFRRKTRRSSISAESYQPGVLENPEITPTNLEHRSCSTSRLQEENLTQNLMRNSRLNPGLSLSHDSIFTPDRADSGLSSSDLENSSLSITVLTPPSKECLIKSQSSCSETSLLSLGSSEVELSPVRTGKISDLDLGVTSYKLSHSAAKHKMAVKPRRNHGAPRSRRRAVTSKSPLPITLEVSEEGATGKSSPLLETKYPESSEVFPKCDKPLPDGKISWTDIVIDSNSKELDEKANELVKVEDESDAKEDEVSTQRSESFFGRFLSRRSDKKKKLLQECNQEESNDEKSHFVKKLSKGGECKGGVKKTPNRRQKMEPVEIPSTSCKTKFESRKDDFLGKKISSSVSPPKNYWHSQATSRSMSPPKVVWPEDMIHVKSPESTVWTRVKTEASLTKSTADSKDWKNPNFVKELTDSISLLAKEKSEKIEKEEEEGGEEEEEEEEDETTLKIRRQHFDDTAPLKMSVENVSKHKTTPLEAVERVKNCDVETSYVDAFPTDFGYIKIPLYSVSFESVHDGYENIQIIEQVKQEVRNTAEAQPSVVETKRETSPGPEQIVISEVEVKKQPEIRSLEKEPEVVKRIKPVISEKPRDLKRVGMPEVIKENMDGDEPKSPEENDKSTSKARSTLVERRKSELLLLTETEKKEWKAKIKPLKKQTSFSEISSDKGSNEPSQKSSLSKEKENLTEKTEPKPEFTEVVVLRKKSVANTSDDQPELMKVFARRSLKVRESEKIAEEMQRSRDSDKENEIIDSPKEDRKKSTTSEREEKKEMDNMTSKEETRVQSKGKASEVKVNITPPKPEIATRKTVFQRYARSLSENNAKIKEEVEIKRDSSILEESNLNKIRNTAEKTMASKEGEEGEREEETGFKRIQQRKAEWERRAQQGAK